MRALLLVVLGLALLWGGYWFMGSRALERGAENWFAAQQARGFIATRDSLSVRGFPNRFDLTVEGLHLEDPARGYGWIAPFAQIFSLSYKPWHLIAALPPEQTFRTPRQDIALTSARLRGSLIVKPGPALTLDRIAVMGEGLAAQSTEGWHLAAATARFATRQDAAQTNAHQIGIEILGLAPDPALMRVLSGQATLPPEIELARLDATAAFAAPLDRHSLETRPALTALTIREGLIRWGTLGFFARGSIAPDAQGLAEGRIDLRLENWRLALAAARAIGLITPETAPTLERALALLAQQSGTPEVLELPLSFQAGRMSLGPIPLGPAPALR
ncbi:MAG TPA: DUF2125 domain-containing protein [Paracoccaceae bacterium]